MKKRIIHFTIGNAGGGTTRFILQLWKAIDKERFQFDFVTMAKQLDYAEELEQEGCKIYYLSAYAEDDRELFIKEVKQILKNGYDAVHLHTQWWRGFLLEQVAKEMGVPQIIIHSHNTDVHIREDQSREDARKLHFEQRELLTEDMATDFLACSQEAADWLYGDRITKNKIQIIPNAIDTASYKYNASIRDQYRVKLGIMKTDFVIGHVGRFSYQKNHEFLIDVFYEIAKVNEHAKLMLIGIGELEESIKNRVKDLRIEERVLFLGKRNDVNNLLQTMDVFAFPSRFEGLGIVLIEAQSSGLKCIASDRIPQMSKITENVEFLLLDKEKWIEHVLKYENDYGRADMSKAIEAAGFGMETLIEKMKKIYCGKYWSMEG